MKLTLVLPYPDAGLSPNARLFFRRKALLAREARDAGYVAVVAQARTRQARRVPLVNMPVRLTFYPPDKRGRDLDNAFASCKSMLDGVASAMNVNDKLFQPVTLSWGAAEKPGKVVLEIET